MRYVGAVPPRSSSLVIDYPDDEHLDGMGADLAETWVTPVRLCTCARCAPTPRVASNCTCSLAFLEGKCIRTSCYGYTGSCDLSTAEIMATTSTALISSGVRHAKSLARMLRLRPFDVSTPNGRADERHRRAAWTALAGATAKILAAATSLIAVPLMLHYLGAERYGMWMTMSSLVTMLSFADFGIGSGILNAISVAHGNDADGAIREYVSSGFAVLTVIAVAVIAIFGVAYPFVPWYKIFNVISPAARTDAAPALAVLICSFALAIPFNVIQRVQLGLQRGFMASSWQCLGSILGLVGVVAAILFRAPLPVLIGAFVGGPLIATGLNSLLFFRWLHPEFAPGVSTISRFAIRNISRTGFLFFVQQVIVSGTYYSDNLIIAQMMGATAVTVYAIPQRLFSLIGLAVGIGLIPLWPAYGEAIAKGDMAWVRRTLWRSILVSLGVAMLGSAILVASGNWLIFRWVGHANAASLTLLLALALVQIAQVGVGATSMYLNGANHMRFQVLIGAITAIAAVALKIVLVRHIGISGVAWGTVIACAIFTAVPTYFFIRTRAFDKSQRRNPGTDGWFRSRS